VNREKIPKRFRFIPSNPRRFGGKLLAMKNPLFLACAPAPVAAPPADGKKSRVRDKPNQA